MTTSISLLPFTQHTIFKEIVRQIKVSKQSKDFLKKNIQKKYSQHISIIQYHRLREKRFQNAQKILLEKQNRSIEKAKEYISLKQEKAKTNKNYSLIERSKKVQNELSHWQQIVKKNQHQYQQKLNQSDSIIDNWNDKLEASHSRKSVLLNEKKDHLRQKTSERSHRTLSSQHLMKNTLDLNPENATEHRYILGHKSRANIHKGSRVSTEGMSHKKKKIQEFQLEKSLVKNIEKEKKINQARYVKHYIATRKTQQQKDRDQFIKKNREDRLSQIKLGVESRNQVLDQKFKKVNLKAKNKDSSLPLIRGSKALNERNIFARFDTIDEVRADTKVLGKRQKKFELEDDQHGPTYDRLIMEKLRNVSLIMRMRHQI